MMNNPGRLVLYAKDVALISDVTKRTASRLIIKIRKHFNRPPSPLVTIRDFCEFTGLQEEKLLEYLK